MKTVALAVPCYNEARRLDADAFLQAVSAYPWLSVLFVDDGSQDETLDVLSHLVRLSPAFAVLHLPERGGKAAAVRAGMRYLVTHSHADLFGFWDADLATPLAHLPDFRAAFEREPDLLAAIGSRWPHLGGSLRRRRGRGLAARIVRSLIRAHLGVEVWDTQCGAKVFTRAAADETFRAPFRTRWLFDVELLARLGRARLVHRVRELPIDDWEDVPGSKITLAAVPGILGELFRLSRTPVL